MCFSLEASFAASAVITGTGIVAYKKAGTNPIRLIALFPILFGIHQFVEGLVWAGALYDSFSGMLRLGTYGFVFLAWVIWPLVIPYVLWKVELKQTRKRILFWMMIVGGIVVVLLSYFLLTKSIEAQIVDHSIIYDYGGHTSSSAMFRSIYVLIVTVPNLISSRGKMWLLGVMNLITYLVSRVYFEEHVVSVWCFFAAVSSMIVLLIVSEQVRNDSKK